MPRKYLLQISTVLPEDSRQRHRHNQGWLVGRYLCLFVFRGQKQLAWLANHPLSS